MWRDDLLKAGFIALKDVKAYYFKPPNISWGIIFPLALTLAFTLRNPEGLEELVPGLVGMASLFGTTSMTAITITFERRIGSLERLLMAPLSLYGVVLGKILGGMLFGLMISAVMLMFGITFMGASVINPSLLLVDMIMATLVFSTLGSFVSVYVREVFEAMTLANLFRFPMIFLCGVFIPLPSMHPVARSVAYLLPLTYVVDGIRYALTGRFQLLTPAWGLLIMMIFTIVFFFLSVHTLRMRTK